MTALALYQQDQLDREGGTPMPRQQYYAQLRDALCQELMQQGYSEWLEQLLLDLRGGQEKIYVVDYAALTECHSMIVLGRALRDASEYVPHLHLRGEKARWEALEGPGSFLMPVTREMTEQLRQLRAVSRQLVDARDQTVIPQADDAAQREIEQVHALNRMLDERCKALQAERDELQSRLRALEEGVITEQVRYAVEARRIQEEEALRQSYAAQQEAARDAYRAQFAREQEAAALRREEEARELAALKDAAAAEYGAVRREMAQELTGMMNMLKERINAWQSGVSGSETLMLAQSYAALHTLAHGQMDELVLRAQDGDAVLLPTLVELQTALHSRVRQLETALLRLGLTVIRPAGGERFNGALHTAGTAAQGVVARCITPGVMARGAQEALLRAEVELA